MSGRLMLEHKRIPFRRVDLLPAVHKPLLRVLGFPGTTVPALRLGDRRWQGTLEISRALDAFQPDPPLFPSDPGRRAAVEEAERWGEAVLQPVPRRLCWWALAHDREALRSFAAGARLHVPLGLAIRTAGPIIAIERHVNQSDDPTVRNDLSRLPGLLDQVDRELDAGTIGSADPNAADYQIATSLRLLLCFDQFRPLLSRRGCGAWAQGLVPDFPGRVGPVFPEAWLSALATGV